VPVLKFNRSISLVRPTVLTLVCSIFYLLYILYMYVIFVLFFVVILKKQKVTISLQTAIVKREYEQQKKKKIKNFALSGSDLIELLDNRVTSISVMSAKINKRGETAIRLLCVG